MTGDYERYNFWNSELDQFMADEKKKKEEMLEIPIDDILPKNTWSTDFYLDGSKSSLSDSDNKLISLIKEIKI